MKRCPKCNADYFDNMLEFCLEDGTRLAFAPQSAAATVPLTRVVSKTDEAAEMHGPIAERKSEETVVIPGKSGLKANDAAAISAAGSNSQLTRIVETAAVGLALAHNWWQWLYLEKTPTYSLTDFFLSANFLMWLLLLAAGTGAGIYSIKYSKNRTFAVIALVTLAINLILFLVPRR